MPVATIQSSGGKKNLPLIIGGIIALLAVVSAVFFIFFNQSQAPVNKAAEPTSNSQPLPTNASNPGQCPADSATCKWVTAPSSEINPTGFAYEIRDLTTNTVVKSGNTPDKQVSFTPIPGHAYSCTVTPVNICSQGAPAKTEATCSPNNSPTPTPTGEVTPTPTVSSTPTPTPTSGVTPTGTVTPTVTPTPTEIIIVSITNTPTPGPSATPTTGVGPSATSIPPVPASGVVGPSIAILFVAGIVILLGLVF